MARHSSTGSSEPRKADLAPEKIPAFIRKIERRISDLERFDPGAVQSRFNDPNLNALKTDIDGTLSDIFGHGTVEYQRYIDATELDTAPIAPGVQLSEVRHGLNLGRDNAIALLKSARRFLEEHLEDAQLADQPSPTAQAGQMIGRKVFIVHGHDLNAAQTVARFIEQLGLEAVILHEQPNRGRALIDKFEQHATDVVFAVVIVTPDDFGAAKSELDALSDDKEKLARLNLRARQNVILELGYFYGKLGRENVVALRKGKVEEPSDNVGVTFTKIDDAGAWRSELAREMADAGIDVDTGALIGRTSGSSSGGGRPAPAQSPPTPRQEADVRVRLVGPATNARFVIENRGPGDARNVNLTLDLEEKTENPLVQGDYDKKLPISILRPGDSIRLMAALTFGTDTHFDGKWTWEDIDGQTHEREGPISL